MLLEKRKENKLSPHYEKEPYPGDSTSWGPGPVKGVQGVQYKRNIQHVKQFVTPATEPKGPSLAEPAEVPSEQICEQELTPSPVMGASAWPVEDQSPIQQQLLPRRSGRVTRPPERFSDYVIT